MPVEVAPLPRKSQLLREFSLAFSLQTPARGTARGCCPSLALPYPSSILAMVRPTHTGFFLHVGQSTPLRDLCVHFHTFQMKFSLCAA